MKFDVAPQSVEEILKLISRTETGRKVLEPFLPYYHEGKVRISQYPTDLLEKLRAALGPGQPIGACFINDEKSGTIYIDQGSPIGVLAPFLLHEMIHSLDKGVWDAARFPSTTESRNDVFLHAETKAFEYQHLFIQELTQRYPEYRDFLAQQYPRVKMLNERLTSTDIAEMYGFDGRRAS